MELCVRTTGLMHRMQTDTALEAALIDRCRKQDYEAFGKFVDAYQNRVFGFVRRMVNSQEDAADITQEVFIKAFQNIARFDARSIAMDSELYAAVDEGIKSMSEKLRSVLLLHDREDLPYDEIASLLKVPVGTVKSRLFLARAHLQGVIQAYLDTGVAPKC